EPLASRVRRGNGSIVDGCCRGEAREAGMPRMGAITSRDGRTRNGRCGVSNADLQTFGFERRRRQVEPSSGLRRMYSAVTRQPRLRTGRSYVTAIRTIAPG